jgi:hypothetical protein
MFPICFRVFMFTNNLAPDTPMAIASSSAIHLHASKVCNNFPRIRVESKPTRLVGVPVESKQESTPNFLWGPGNHRAPRGSFSTLARLGDYQFIRCEVYTQHVASQSQPRLARQNRQFSLVLESSSFPNASVQGAEESVLMARHSPARRRRLGANVDWELCRCN